MPTKAATISLNRQRYERAPDVRESAATRGYDGAWQRFRKWYAGSHAPICARCNAAMPSRAMHLDHVIPLADGGTRLSESNVQWLCHGCHNAKTSEDKAGRVGVGSQNHNDRSL